MRKLILVVFFLGLATTGFGPPALIESDRAQTPLYSWQVPLARDMDPPLVSAEAFVIVDGPTGRILSQEDANRRLAIASLTKIATAVTAIDTGRVS